MVDTTPINEQSYFFQNCQGFLGQEIILADGSWGCLWKIEIQNFPQLSTQLFFDLMKHKGMF